MFCAWLIITIMMTKDDCQEALLEVWKVEQEKVIQRPTRKQYFQSQVRKKLDFTIVSFNHCKVGSEVIC